MLQGLQLATRPRIWCPQNVSSVFNKRRGRWAATASHRRVSKTRSGTPRSGPDDPTHLLPPTLAQQPLRDLAILCGCNLSGTKAALRTGLEAAIADQPASRGKGPAASSWRILSIDMGVRNLAFCLLQADVAKGTAQLVAWERLSLMGERTQGGADGGVGAKASVAKTAVDFSPPAMAAMAAQFVHDRLLQLTPSHVLVERQRFRSGGGAAVLEWTVRVNSLEAMLHGILAYEQQTAVVTTGCSPRSTQAVSPQRVSQFLLRGGMARSRWLGVTPRKAQPARMTKAKDIKDAKEAFVAGILRAANGTAEGTARAKPLLLRYDAAVGETVDAFLARWDAKQSRIRGRAKGSLRTDASVPSQTLSKLDDLADCITQGVVWLEWERNKAILRKDGAEALLAAKQLLG